MPTLAPAAPRGGSVDGGASLDHTHAGGAGTELSMITTNLNEIIDAQRLQARIDESAELTALQQAAAAADAGLAAIRAVKAQVEAAEADLARRANEAHRRLKRAQQGA